MSRNFSACDEFPFISSITLFTLCMLYMLVFVFYHIVLNFKRTQFYWDSFRDKDYNKLDYITKNDNNYSLFKSEEIVIDKNDDEEVTIDKDNNEDPFLDYERKDYIYETISDSISDGNSLSRRIFNGTCVLSLILILFFIYYEYITRPDNYSFVYYYVLEFLSILLITIIPCFPSNTKDLKPENARLFSTLIHSLSIIIAMFLMIGSVSSYLNVLNKKNKRVFMLEFFFYGSIFSLLLLILSFGIDFCVKKINIKRIAKSFSYLFEAFLLFFIILTFLISSLYRNNELKCIEHK